MSALGQKQTCAAQKVMSALLPIADIQDFVLTKRKPRDNMRGFYARYHGLLRCIRTHELTAAWASAATWINVGSVFYIVSDVRRLGIEASRG